MTIHRTRTIIRYLVYKDERDKIPKKALFTGIKIGGNLPSICSKIGYASFGMFLDKYIQKILCLMYRLNFTPFDNRVFDPKISNYKLLLITNKHYFNEGVPSKSIFKKDNPYYLEVCKFIEKNFSRCYHIELEPEWVHENIAGHPDIIIDDVIYDVKTTGRFNSMREQTIFQLLTYYCLAKHLGKKINKIGLILPAQNKVLVQDISNWDYIPFWNSVKDALAIKISLTPSEDDLFSYRAMIAPHVGSHITKESTVYKTLSGYPKHLPFQIFLAGRSRAQFKVSDLDIGRTRKMVEDEGYRFYVHSPYTFNLSKYHEDDWMVKWIIKYLEACSAMGCKGLVVHCGVKAKGVEYQTAYDNMYKTVCDTAKHASKSCPLLIETSAKETGELLWSPEDLSNFYLSLPKKIRKRTAICVDTCHVFAAGYLPMEFIGVLEKNNIPINLVHFNDSKRPLGSCKDRHEHLGIGYIGLDNLINVGSWAISNKIDLVHE